MSELPAALPQQLPPAVRALAEADFSAIAPRFTAAGFTVAEPADGIITIRAGGGDDDDDDDDDDARPAVLVSVGVHGDETGPIEVVAYLLDALSPSPGSSARSSARSSDVRA